MTNDDEKMPKNAFKFICESCDFKCSKQSNYITHLSTRKHKMMTNDDKKTPKNATAFMCSCGKSYKYRQGLSVHKKKCLQIKESSVITSDNKIDATLLMDMIKQNRELQQKEVKAPAEKPDSKPLRHHYLLKLNYPHKMYDYSKFVPKVSPQFLPYDQSNRSGVQTD